LNFLTRTPSDAAQAALEELSRALIEYTAADQIYLYRAGEQPGLFDPALALGSLSLQEKQSFWASQVDAAAVPLAALLTRFPADQPFDCAQIDAVCAREILPNLRTRAFLLYPLKNRGQVLGLALIGWLAEAPALPAVQVRMAGVVARSMALEIDSARLYEQAHQQQQQARMAQETTQAILRRDDLADILACIASECMRAADALGCAVRLLDENSALLPVVQVGQAFLSPLDRSAPDSEARAQILQKTEPYVYTPDCDPVNEAECSLIASVPLLSGSNTLGFLELYQMQVYFQSKDLTTARAFADQAAVAVELDQMYRRLQQTAVAEERARLSRDLHDSISQSLYAMTLYTRAAQRQMAEGNTASVDQHLTALNAASRGVLGEMRLLIYALRPAELEQRGLKGILEQRLQAVEARSGLAYDLDIQLEHGLPPEIEENLYHIAMEALNNTIKHAQAGQVWVSIRQEARTVRLLIRDDGTGFDPTAQANGGVGLKSMQERVARMNGRLIIETGAGAGVSVCVEVEYE
jgi:signal transduction histidine kinase